MKTQKWKQPTAEEFVRQQTEVQHTPTPWKVVEGIEIWKDKTHIADCLDGDTNDNAAFIVRAVNAHEELVEAIQWALAGEYVTQDGQRLLMVAGETRAILERTLTKAVEK